LLAPSAAPPSAPPPFGRADAGHAAGCAVAIRRSVSAAPLNLPMNALKRPQRDKARQFMVFTGASERAAIEQLKRHDWHLEGAVDDFFSGGGSSFGPQVDNAKIQQWFDKYHKEQNGDIGVTGMEQFCTDLGVDPSDQVMLIIAWQMKAKTMCVFTRDEWMAGMTSMGCDTLEGLKGSFDTLKAQLADAAAFKDYYSFCFGFAKEPGPSVRSIPIDVANAMWQLTLAGRFKHLDAWTEFLEKRKEKAITKDVWDMLLTFHTDIKPDLSNFDDDGAWPVCLDDFVEHLRESGVGK